MLLDYMIGNMNGLNRCVVNMEKFYLELPSINRKKEIIDYIYEFAKYNSDLNGIGILDQILEGMNFEEALELSLKMKYKKYAKKYGRIQSKTFLLIRANDNKIVGSINIRWNLSKEMLKFRGHIGYGIRPTERKKGYNKINLYLGLMKSYEMGLDKVMIACEANNIPSDRTLKALGGVLERSEIDPDDGLLTNVYWFDVLNCLNNYKDKYYPYVYKKQ